MALVKPAPPIIRIYIQEIGRIDAEPKGALDTGPGPVAGPANSFAGWFGKNGAKCALAITGPTPGPPPPCGMQNVLCKFKCETSAPNFPGFATPTSAFKLAPST